MGVRRGVAGGVPHGVEHRDRLRRVSGPARRRGSGNAARAEPGQLLRAEILYAFDVGDPDSGELQLQPTLNVELPHGLFLNLFPSSDIRINLGTPKGSGRLFFPFDALVGVMVTPSLVTSLEASLPIVKDYPVYDFKLEAKVSYFFD